MKLLCVGDIGLGYIDPHESNKISLAEEINHLSTHTLLNWELPIGSTANPTPRSSGPRIIGDPANAKIIQCLSPGFAGLANNHILDAGINGLVETQSFLAQAGFQTFGAGTSQQEILQPIIWDIPEGKLGLINWVFPETHPDWIAIPGPNCWPGEEQARQIIQSLKRQVDWVIAYVHWSDENFSYPRPEDRRIARELAAMGVNMIIGNHPHVVRGMEVIGTCPVFYSVGNFFFPDIQVANGGWIIKQAPRNRESLGILVTITNDCKLNYTLLSFFQINNHVGLDQKRKAELRLKRTSSILNRTDRIAYVQWYTKKRQAFDQWWGYWHFGFRRLGIRNAFAYARQTLIK